MKGKQKSRAKMFLIAIIAIIVGTITLVALLDFNKNQIFPFTKEYQNFDTSHETLDKEINHSKSKANIEENQLVFSYQLSDAVEEPFAGVYIHSTDSSDRFFDFSNHDIFEIELSASKSTRIPIYFTIDYKGFTSDSNVFSNLHLRSVIDYSSPGTYKIHKNDFEIPSWWLRIHGMNKEDVNTIDFSRVNYIVINSCQILGPNINDEISISSINYSHNNQPFYIGYLTFLIVLFLGLWLYNIISKRKVLIPYLAKAIEQGKGNKKSKIEEIKHYIAEHYDSSELSVEVLEKNLGIPKREIGTLFKKELNSSFKAYLNKIRMSEVERLLKTSDAPISEIAYNTGYNNISHFNRLFKSFHDQSPKEYRDANINK